MTAQRLPWACVSRPWTVLHAALPLVLFTGQSPAQPPAPQLSHVFPVGGQRGATFEATVFGTNLQGTNIVRISGPGVTANVIQGDKPDNVRFSVTIAPDAELGERDIRVGNVGGASNRYRFIIGDLPEVIEVEPNTKPVQAQKLASLPILVNGQITEPDRDLYKFSASAGQTVVCRFEGRPLLPYIPDAVPGWLDGCLTLFDAEGQELATVDDEQLRPDPVLAFTIPRDGEYVLEVRDILYRGRPSFVYRVSIGVLPHLRSIFPLGGQRKTETEVEIHGFNLPAPTMKIADQPDSGPIRMVRPTGPGPVSNTLPFGVEDFSEIRETEPNDTLAQATRIKAPSVVDGRIQSDCDNDYFVFAAHKSQVFIMDVQARRLGSPLDSMLYLLNAKGQELAGMTSSSIPTSTTLSSRTMPIPESCTPSRMMGITCCGSGTSSK